MPTLIQTTAEGITLRREIAGAGSRLAAGLIDGALVGVVLSVIGLMIAVAASFDPSGLSSFALGILVGGLPVVIAIYHLAFHALWAGARRGSGRSVCASPRSRGLAPSVTQHLLRSALWPVDVLLPLPFPLFVPIGLVLVVLTERSQRLGDLVAGTLVVRETTAHRTAEPLAGERLGERAERLLTSEPGVVARLDDEDYVFLRELLAREGLQPEVRARLERSAAEFYAERLQLGAARGREAAWARKLLEELFLVLRESKEARLG